MINLSHLNRLAEFGVNPGISMAGRGGWTPAPANVSPSGSRARSSCAEGGMAAATTPAVVVVCTRGHRD